MASHCGNSRNQPATADGYKERIDGIRMLAKNLNAHRALSSDHVEIVIRVNEDSPLL
jgi:hypothetical protein